MQIRVVVPVVLLTVFLWAAELALAQEEKEPKTARTEDRIEVDFRDMSLKELFDLMEETTGSPILYPQTLGQQTVYASGVRSLTHKQLLSVFQAILELYGHTLVSVPVWPGVIIQKVVQSPHGRNYPGPTYSKKEIMEDPTLLEGRQDMITVIYPLRYAQAMNVQSQFRQLIDPRGGTIFGIPNVDVLVLTDFAPSVRRMVDIMNLMDVPGPALSMEVIFLEHALAEDIVPILDQLTQITRDFRQQRGGGQLPRGDQTSFVTDERTNSIIVNGPREVIDNLKDLVRQIDVKLDKEPSGIHIYRLKHTNAEDVGATVNTLLQSVSLRQLESAYTGAGPAPLPPPGPGPTPAPAPRPSTPSRGRYGDEERAAAIADKVSNSLIVVAGEAEYAVIRKIIDSLDIRRPQVLIEVVVLEMSEGEGFNLGVELTTLDGAHDGSTRGFAATRFGFSNLVDEDGSPLMGPGIPRGQIPSATQGSVVGIHRGKEWRIPAIINLIGSESTVNVMSLPRIVTNDNKEAKLKVTDNVPYATSSSTASSANQSFGGFKEAGIEITITPHISEGDYLRLELDQSISQFTGTSQVISTGDSVTGVLPPSRTRRELTNVITVPDGKTVIIGGLTSRSKQRTITKIPLLGDIPLLGELFRKTSMEWKRTNLYVFITPHIIRGEGFEDLEAMSRAELESAKALGVDLSASDRHYRRAFREEREMASLEEGRTSSLMEYRSPRSDKRE